MTDEIGGRNTERTTARSGTEATTEREESETEEESTSRGQPSARDFSEEEERLWYESTCRVIGRYLRRTDPDLYGALAVTLPRYKPPVSPIGCLSQSLAG